MMVDQLGVEAKVLAVLTACAEHSEPCPTNDRLCEILGVNSKSSPVRILNRMVKAGQITIARYATTRVVTIVETGRATAGGEGVPHWSTRIKRSAAVEDKAGTGARPKSVPVPIPVPAPMPHAFRADLPRVDRDPCPRCGVRRDVGCRHNPHLRELRV